MLDEQHEARASELYSTAMSRRTTGDASVEETLMEASRLNPFVGEPHVARAQLLCARGEWKQACDAASEGLKLLECMGTAWDKRMPFNAWVCWSRAIYLQATSKEWPKLHGGMESLGATHPSMQFRKLNQERTLQPAGKKTKPDPTS